MKTISDSSPEIIVPKTIVPKISQTPNITGFRETLTHGKKNIDNPKVSPDIICPAIFKTGKNITKKYYFPSEFPNLTKLKSLTTNPVKKGGRKTRRSNRKVI